jgi:hypothetical protein
MHWAVLARSAGRRGEDQREGKYPRKKEVLHPKILGWL